MEELYVLGGIQRAVVKDPAEDWLLFERAVIGAIKPGATRCELLFTYESPAGVRPSAESSVLFKAGAVAAEWLYACTSTEVLVLRLPSLEPVQALSLPCFNDLHHVRPTAEGTMLVVATGLDMVVEINREGRLLRSWSAVGGDPWRRFDRRTDYRQVATLKPYLAHPNYVFQAQGEYWCTRGDLADAVCLDDVRRRVALPTQECIHDGWVEAGWIYFTSVDGHLFVVREDSMQLEADYDLNRMQGANPSGYSWCRGVTPAGDGQVWVGFTRIRNTRWKEKVRWIKNLVRPVSRPTRLALFDLRRGQLVREVNLEAAGMHATFGALPAGAAAAAA